jgi:ABC-2 type transport system permease protein/lipopolysaccharide transport system permease protein
MKAQLGLAWRDLVASLRLWELWIYIGLQDIKLRYRRSVIGPFWITLSMSATIVGVGILFSSILRSDITSYLPYFTVGFILWSYIVSLVVDGCMIFINDGPYIRQLPTPLLTYQFKATWRAIIVLAHNFVIFVAVSVYFGLWAGWGYLEAAVGFVLLTINATCVGLLLGIVSSRYRDVPPIVQSVMGVLFFLTPILWERTAIPGRALFVEINPLYHLIEIVRAPLLGTSAALSSWLIVIGMTAMGAAIVFVFFARYRRRIPYWV